MLRVKCQSSFEVKRQEPWIGELDPWLVLMVADELTIRGVMNHADIAVLDWSLDIGRVVSEGWRKPRLQVY